MSEISAASQPKPAGRRVQQEPRINGIEVLIHKRLIHQHGFGVAELGRFRIERTGPHRHDLAGMAAAHAAARGPIDHEVAVSDPDGIRSGSATGPDGSAVPVPAILRNQSPAAGSEREILAVTHDDGRRIMDKRAARLGVQRTRRK